MRQTNVNSLDNDQIIVENFVVQSNSNIHEQEVNKQSNSEEIPHVNERDMVRPMHPTVLYIFLIFFPNKILLSLENIHVGQHIQLQ